MIAEVCLGLSSQQLFRGFLDLSDGMILNPNILFFRVRVVVKVAELKDCVSCEEHPKP